MRTAARSYADLQEEPSAMDDARSSCEAGAAIAALLGPMRPRLVRIAAGFGIKGADCEDLLQDTLLALVAQWPAIREPEPWLRGAMRNRCKYFLRGRRRALLKMIAVDPAELERLAGAAPGLEGHWRLDLERLSRALPPRQRRLLALAVGLGMTWREVAERPGGRRPGSLRVDYRRAVSRLKAGLEP
jgi:RNA polymerase sigma factor (sigma-70 family)